MKNAFVFDGEKRNIPEGLTNGARAEQAGCGVVADVSAELRRRGIPHSPAQYDAGGNCLTCGEGGRCPGVHTFEEIQRADRAQKGSAT